MYPTVVIVLVETQRSMADICEIGPSIATKLPASEARSATLGRVSFAAEKIRTTTDSKAESQRTRASESQGEQERDLEELGGHSRSKGD